MSSYIENFIFGISFSDLIWILLPIFFVGLITDKYQEEFKTSVGNAVSNGAFMIFTGFSWLQLIFSKLSFSIDIILSQILLSFFIIFSGFYKQKFAENFGRIRVITFMLVFFTILIYMPDLLNLLSIFLVLLVFPFYYFFITELIKFLPSINRKGPKIKEFHSDVKNIRFYLKRYLE